MQFAVFQAWETGLLQVPMMPGEFLCWVFWGFFVIGFLIQWLVLKKARRGAWVFPALLVLGLLAGEVGCWTITGWDLLLPLFGWWLCFALLLGAAVAWLIQARKRRRKQAER